MGGRMCVCVCARVCARACVCACVPASACWGAGVRAPPWRAGCMCECMARRGAAVQAGGAYVMPRADLIHARCVCVCVCGGGALCALLRVQAAHIFRKMVEVVNHCHELGVMHRRALAVTARHHTTAAPRTAADVARCATSPHVSCTRPCTHTRAHTRIHAHAHPHPHTHTHTHTPTHTQHNTTQHTNTCTRARTGTSSPRTSCSRARRRRRSSS
jgi:hypothetical protein